MPDNTLRNSLLAAGTTAAVATVLAVAGWWSFEFDRALFTYAQALILSLTLTAYRFSVWAHRPPTKIVYQRAWQMIRSTNDRPGLAKHLLSRTISYFTLNRFVWKRGLNRWSAHWPIMLGCVMAFAIVVPLIFGWVWFETPADDFGSYKVMNFGIHLTTIRVDGLEAFLAFHGLVWASFPVIIGCSVALWRRFRDRGDQAVQTIGNDIMPLFILLSIAITGLLMTVSYSFLSGTGHAPLANLHMIIVCGTLLWLPYSKLFHIPQRTLKFAHMVYEFESQRNGPARCERCNDKFADQQQVTDLIALQKQLGYRYEMANNAGHYQSICPACRRASLVLAQGERWKNATRSRVMTESHGS